MDEDRIGLVLARASELRLKLSNCIHKASTFNAQGDEQQNTEYQQFGADEEDSLFNITDALQSLEAQLSSLQALQQQQWYEKEAALAEIECSQKKLLEKLKEFEGKDLEVIHEAIAFVGETVDDSNDILLPPYPSRPLTVGSESRYLSHFTSTCKYLPNGSISNGVRVEFPKGRTCTDENEMVPESKSPLRGIKVLLGAAVKATFTVIGFICVLRLGGFQARLRKGDDGLKIWGLVAQQQENGNECPAGRIPVIEDGEVRCVVKERIVVPFGSVVASPDAKYGCG